VDPWKEAQTMAFWFVGWSVLDWLKALLGSLAATVVGWIVTRYRRSIWKREFRGAAIAIIAVILLTGIISNYYHPTPQLAAVPHPSPSPSGQRTPARFYPLPLTLKNLFDTDFPYMNVGGELMINNSKTVVANYRLFIDFQENAKFFAIFVARRTELPIHSPFVQASQSKLR
jgi:hypothetical protein